MAKLMILLKEPIFGHTAVVGEEGQHSPMTIGLKNVELWCCEVMDNKDLAGDKYFWGAFGHIDDYISSIEIPWTQVRMIIHDEATIERLKNYEA